MTDRQASALRAVLRAVLVCLTAFGFDMSADQVAAVQLLGEAILQASTQLRKDS